MIMKHFYDLGIDLGTTNSSAAVPNMNNTCTIIQNITDSMDVTPSAIWVKGERKIIGQRAYTSTNIDDVKKEFKRDMGTDTVYEFSSSGNKLTPVDLSAEILMQLRRDAETRCKKDIRSVVVTVPAAFTLVQCEATKKAAEIAGFKNVVLLQEPIAASIAYGAEPDAKDQYWLVFDYGGGTLDVSIISTHDGRLDNITSMGDTHKGGKDLDKLLFDRVILPKLQSDYDLQEPIYEVTRAVLMLDAERCKKELSNQTVGYFETFSAEDNGGKTIDVNYEITREEFESAISEEVQSAVQVARKVLDESGIAESSITKLILVGGTTFIPYVRKCLQETFNIPLDINLNPMTVVSEGAALYAAITPIEDYVEYINVDEGEFLLELEYEPITSEEKVNILGKVVNAHNMVSRVKIDCVANESAQSALWTSGWYDIFNHDEHGVFDINVKVCNFNEKNIYKVTATTDDGSPCELVGYMFEILHNENALKSSAPPLINNVGIEVTDGIDNIIEWFFKKDTKLPVKSKPIPFLLNKTLDPKEASEFSVSIYEGDDSINPSANTLVRRVRIRSQDLTRTLDVGTEVEITMEIDENRCVTISGYIPVYDYVLLEETLGSSEESYKNYEREMKRVEAQLVETKYTIDLLRKMDIDVSELETAFRHLEQDFDKYTNLVDIKNDEVHQYIRRFYKFQTKVILAERSNRKKDIQSQEESVLERIKRNVSIYADISQQRQYTELLEQLDTAKSPDTRKFIINKLNSLETVIISSNINWLKSMYLSIHTGFASYTDPESAAFWKKEADRAIMNDNTESLLGAIRKLEDLRIKTVSESTNRKLADLKKI